MLFSLSLSPYSRKQGEVASRNRKIAQRQSFCDYVTIFLIFSALISIFVALILLFLIALDAYSMQTTFTIILIILCILTVLLVLFASFTANFYFYYNQKTQSIDWMLHYGRKNAESSNYYFGKSLNREAETNETESSLIEQIWGRTLLKMVVVREKKTLQVRSSGGLEIIMLEKFELRIGKTTQKNGLQVNELLRPEIHGRAQSSNSKI